jgi:hypothetical protein
MIDFALSILDNESADHDSCVWLDGTGLLSIQVCGCARVIQVGVRDVDEIAFELTQ